jgi:hypothetical protein
VRITSLPQPTILAGYVVSPLYINNQISLDPRWYAMRRWNSCNITQYAAVQYPRGSFKLTDIQRGIIYYNVNKNVNHSSNGCWIKCSYVSKCCFLCFVHFILFIFVCEMMPLLSYECSQCMYGSHTGFCPRTWLWPLSGHDC